MEEQELKTIRADAFQTFLEQVGHQQLRRRFILKAQQAEQGRSTHLSVLMTVQLLLPVWTWNWLVSV